MIKYLHLVYVKHRNCDRAFLFETPEVLKKGDEVLCDTRYGESEGRCASDSFVISENAFHNMSDFIGITLPIRSVCAKIKYEEVRRKVVERFDDLPF